MEEEIPVQSVGYKNKNNRQWKRYWPSSLINFFRKLIKESLLTCYVILLIRGYSDDSVIRSSLRNPNVYRDSPPIKHSFNQLPRQCHDYYSRERDVTECERTYFEMSGFTWWCRWHIGQVPRPIPKPRGFSCPPLQWNDNNLSGTERETCDSLDV